MNATLVLLAAIVVLVVGYVAYGGWLAKQWGLDDSNVTPAHALEDGTDYVPAKPYVVLGHHFSSIAGAGPVIPVPRVGSAQARVFVEHARSLSFHARHGPIPSIGIRHHVPRLPRGPSSRTTGPFGA